MTEAAAADLRGLFLRAPAALSFVHRHPESVPARIPTEFAKAGLIESDKGKARRVVWLNPLKGWQNYEPIAAAMQAAGKYLLESPRPWGASGHVGGSRS